jgi:hypothetical protein
VALASFVVAGVQWTGKRWKAVMWVEGEKKILGHFDDEKDVRTERGSAEKSSELRFSRVNTCPRIAGLFFHISTHYR